MTGTTRANSKVVAPLGCAADDGFGYRVRMLSTEIKVTIGHPSSICESLQFVKATGNVPAI